MQKSRSLPPCCGKPTFSSYLDFTLKPCKGLHLFILCCFIIYVHRGCNIRVSHNLLNNLQVSFVLTKASQNVCRKWWQLKCGNSSGSRRSSFASSSSFALQFFFEFDVLIPKGIECHLAGLINKKVVLQVLLYLLLHITKRSPALLSFRNFVGCY